MNGSLGCNFGFIILRLLSWFNFWD